jgi:hypothetical protein
MDLTKEDLNFLLYLLNNLDESSNKLTKERLRTFISQKKVEKNQFSSTIGDIYFSLLMIEDTVLMSKLDSFMKNKKIKFK